MQIRRKMSAQTVMASISRTLAHRRESKALINEVRFAGDLNKDKLYEPKQNKKIIRVLTVVAYLISVSFVAIVLSGYYLFIWNPKEQSRPNLASKAECHNSPQVLGFSGSAELNGIQPNETANASPIIDSESNLENSTHSKINHTNLLQILSGKMHKEKSNNFTTSSSQKKFKREEFSIDRQVILSDT